MRVGSIGWVGSGDDGKDGVGRDGGRMVRGTSPLGLPLLTYLKMERISDSLNRITGSHLLPCFNTSRGPDPSNHSCDP